MCDLTIQKDLSLPIAWLSDLGFSKGTYSPTVVVEIVL